MVDAWGATILFDFFECLNALGMLNGLVIKPCSSCFDKTADRDNAAPSLHYYYATLLRAAPPLGGALLLSALSLCLSLDIATEGSHSSALN